MTRPQHCERCGRLSKTQRHHVVTVEDGGTDEWANMSELCEMCHTEWHVYADPVGALTWDRQVAFTQWLDTIPVAVLARMQIRGVPDEVTYGAMQAMWRGMRDFNRYGGSEPESPDQPTTAPD